MASTLALLQRFQRLERLRAQARLHRITAETTRQASISDLPLLEVVPVLSPRLEAPRHLAPYSEVLSEAPGAQSCTVIAAPPQHGKTVLADHALVWWMARASERRSFAYATYSQDRADEVSDEVRLLAEAAGIEPVGKKRLWHTNTGARVRFTSIGGAFTGSAVDAVLIVDDPFKDRRDANSKQYRENAWNWLNDVAIPRMHPGASVALMATRWHVDDLSGRCISRLNWRYLNLQAICDDPNTDPLGRELGEALWPSQRPVEFLRPRMANLYGWASLYQGMPRPKGGEVFQEPHYFDPRQEPVSAFRVGYGVDLAYTKKTSADWSVCLRGKLYNGKIYIVDMQRKQVDAPSFTLTLKAKQAEMGGPMRWYASGTERGAGQFVRQKVRKFEIKNASADKLVRATPASENWNLGNILVPGGDDAPEWADILVDEVTGFTGVEDPQDDVVDALAALNDLLLPLKRPGSGQAHTATGRDQYRPMA